MHDESLQNTTKNTECFIFFVKDSSFSIPHASLFFLNISYAESMVSGALIHNTLVDGADAAGHSSATAHIHPSFTASDCCWLHWDIHICTRVFCFGARGGKHQKWAAQRSPTDLPTQSTRSRCNCRRVWRAVLLAWWPHQIRLHLHS